MRRLLLVASMFVAGAALGAPPAVVFSSGGILASTPKARSVHITFSADGSGESTAIPNVCTVWTGDFRPETGATAQVWGVTTAGQSAITGTLLTTLSEANTRVGPAPIAQPFFKLVVVTPPAPGETARLDATCAQVPVYLRPWPVTDTPPPCITAMAGAVYYDISLRTLCHCLDDGSPAWETIDRAIPDTPSVMSCG